MEAGSVPAQGASAPQDSGGSGLYAEALAGVPEQYRGYVEPHFKKWDQAVGPKLQEAAEYRKRWEPFEELGVHEMEPDTLKELLGFHQVASDPDQFLQWYQQVGEQLREEGLLDQEQPDEQEEPQQDPEIQEIKSQFQEFQQWRQQQEQERAYNDANQFLSGELDKIRQENPNMEFSDEVSNAIFTFARNYADSDRQNCVKKGFQDYQNLIGTAEKGLFKSKSEAPAPAESGGVPNTGMPPVTSFDEAKRIGMERLRQGV
jgi:hypothetical protein